MKLLFKKVFLLSLLFTSSAFAGGASVGVPSNILVLPDQNIVTFDAGTYAGVACATNTLGKWAFKSDTPGGKAMLALLLTSSATEKPLTVNGFTTGVCDVWGDRETVRFMFVAS